MSGPYSPGKRPRILFRKPSEVSDPHEYFICEFYYVLGIFCSLRVEKRKGDVYTQASIFDVTKEFYSWV